MSLSKSQRTILVSGVTLIAILMAGSYLWRIQRQSDSPALQGPRENLTICTAITLATLVYVAQEQAYFSDAGLNVTLKSHLLGKGALDDMLNGQCELATVAETPVVYRSLERQDFRILAVIGSSDNFTKIIARRDRGTLKAEDLRGKRIAVTKGTTFHYCQHMILAKHGISPSEVTPVFMGGDAMPGALSKGEIDAFSLLGISTPMARALLGENGLIIDEHGLCLATVNLVATNNFLNAKPQAARSVLQALLRAAEYGRSHPQQMLKITAKLEQTDEAQTDSAAKAAGMTWEISLKQALLLTLEAEARWAIKNGLAPVNVTQAPNYLDYLWPDGLMAVKPSAVSVVW